MTFMELLALVSRVPTDVYAEWQGMTIALSLELIPCLGFLWLNWPKDFMITNVDGALSVDPKTEILCQVTAEHVAQASGLNAGNDPITRCLKETDSEGFWQVGPKVVCRYHPDGDFAYDLPLAASEFLANWNMEQMKAKMGSGSGPAPEGITFTMAAAKYPKEHLVPGYRPYEVAGVPEIAF